jgi:hypothetical protein
MWRRKKREESPAGNICAGNGETSVVVTLEDNEWSGVSGTNGVAVATGRHGRATAVGECGVALAAGYQGVAKVVAAEGVAVATGVLGAASAGSAYGVAMTTATGGMVRGKLGCALIAVDRLNGVIFNIDTAIVDGVNIKEDTWYACCGGKLVEVER